MDLVLSLIRTKNTAKAHAALLWLFCAYVAAVPDAAFAVEEVEPTFEATEPTQKWYDSSQFDLNTYWTTSIGDFKLLQDCRPYSRRYDLGDLGENVFEIASPSEQDTYRAACKVYFIVPDEPGKTLGILGQVHNRSNRFTLGFEAIKKLNNQEPILIRQYDGGIALREVSDAGNGPTEILLLPPPNYSYEISRFIEFVKTEGIRADEERATREQERKQRKETAEKVGIVIMAVLAVFFALGVLGFCLQIYNSRVIQKGFRKSLDATSEKIEKTKQLYRRRRSFSTAKELSLWVELRDKGEITQDEFEKRKRNLME